MSERRSLPWPGSADYLRRRAVFLASSHVSARFPATVASRKRGHEEARRDGADEGACETVARHGEKTSGGPDEATKVTKVLYYCSP